MKLIHSVAELQAELSAAKQAGKTIGFVPTMGAIHQGHISLLKIAQQKADFTVVSIFINPLQFGEGEDFDHYPRTVGVDARLLTDAEADVLFAPNAAEVYPKGLTLNHPDPGETGSSFEGAARPGHFEGMLTVVSRLFDLVSPDLAVFGTKDAQQLFLVKKMVGEQLRSGQRPPLKIIAAPTIRDADGLALSSRNRKLSAQERSVATTINLALTEAAEAASSGLRVAEIRTRAILLLDPEIRLDYLELVDAATFQPVTPDFTGSALAIFAGMVGATRLLDNRELRILGQDEHRPE